MSIDIRSFEPDNDVINVLAYVPPKDLRGKGEHIPCAFLDGKTTLFPKELKHCLYQALSKSGVSHLWINNPSDRALPCRVMRSGQPWQKGKIVISINFIPDPPDEPVNTDSQNELDELRK